ncbi:MAG TPA: hypothetical protein VMU33_08695 [Burkholderiaceae bacterium]|nr:hypothetical protein [Burkholderiaceae bacterium]
MNPLQVQADAGGTGRDGHPAADAPSTTNAVWRDVGTIALRVTLALGALCGVVLLLAVVGSN